MSSYFIAYPRLFFGQPYSMKSFKYFPSDDKTTFKAGSEITNNFFEFRAMSWASGKSVTDSTNGDVISNGSSMFEIPLAQRYVKSPVATSGTQEISFTYIGKGNQIVSAAGNSITSVSVEAAK